MEQVQQLQREAATRAGVPTVFVDRMADGGKAPTMVVVPGGSFTIGAPDDERARMVAAGTTKEAAELEKPMPGIVVASFALGKTEVTRREFAAFMASSGYKLTGRCYQVVNGRWEEHATQNWQAPGYEQGDEHPVVCVFQGGCPGLCRLAEQQDRRQLPPAVRGRVELAARAGTTTRRYWGDDLDDKAACDHANLADRSYDPNQTLKEPAACTDGFARTAPVASKRPNALGLYDMLGNVREWVEDCRQASYARLPKDGKAYGLPDDDACGRAVRGGSWMDAPKDQRSAARFSDDSSHRHDFLGFRLARNLAP